MRKATFLIALVFCILINTSSMNENYTSSHIHTLNELLEIQAMISQLNIEELVSISLNETKGTLTIGLTSFDSLDTVKSVVKNVNIYGIPVEYKIAEHYERYEVSIVFPDISS